MIHSPPLLLFDGVCHLCNGLVAFILRHEKEKQILFMPLQAEHAREQMLAFERSPDSIVFIENGVAYTKSKAVFMIARHLKLPWSWISNFGLLPIAVSDFLYDLIAKYRYKIFGKRSSCMIPGERWKHRFLS